MPAWTTPNDFTTGHVVSSTEWNAFNGTNGNLAFLYGDTAWTSVSGFTNGWGASGTTPGFIMLGRIVYLRGAMTAGTAATTAFTLPSGYRPSFTSLFFTSNGTATVNLVTVNSTGTVVPTTSATVWLSSISFPVV